jgi:predicted permease
MLIRRIRYWLENRRRYGELRTEMEEHIAERAGALERDGFSPSDALAEARRRFGNQIQKQEESREIWIARWWADFVDNFRIATRMLLHNKGWIAVAVFSLAVGIGTNVGMLGLALPFLEKVPVRDPDELITFRFGRTGRTTLEELNQILASFFVFEQLQAANRTLTDVFAFSYAARCAWQMTSMGDCPGNGQLIANGRGDVARFQYVSGNYFSALGIGAVRGRTLSTADDSLSAEPVGMVSYRYWQQRFGGDPGVVGLSAILDNEPVTIIGVLPDGVRDLLVPEAGARGAPDIILPLALRRRVLERRGRTAAVREAFKIGVPTPEWLVVMGRRKPGVTVSQVEADLGEVAARAARQDWENFLNSLSQAEREQLEKSRLRPFINKMFPRARVVPASRGVLDIHPGVRDGITFLFTICGIFLFIVCMNVTTLLLARAAVRQTEFGVRAALGAGRGRLIGQLLTESCLIGLVAGVIGLAVGQWPAVVSDMLGPEMPRPPFSLSLSDWRVLTVTFGLSFLVGLVAGVGPAWSVVTVAARPGLRRVVPFGATRSLLTRSMLIAQVALSIALLIVAGLFMKSVQNCEATNVGFNIDNLAVFTVAPGAIGYDSVRVQGIYEQLLDRLSRVAGVKSASFSSGVLLGRDSGVPVLFPKPRDSAAATTSRAIVHPGFFGTMEIPLRFGRTFLESDQRAAPRVAVVNEAFVRNFFSNDNPIGAYVRLDAPQQLQEVEIVGVVGDTKSGRDAERAVAPMLYTSSFQEEIGRATFSVRTAGTAPNLLPQIREAIQSVDASLPIIGLVTYQSVFDLQALDRIVSGRLTRLVGGLALLFAMIGLFSLMSYTVSRRTREIGIRMSLGARRSNVLLSVLRETLSLVVIGVVVGVAFASALSPVVQSQMMGLSPHDPGTIGFVIVLALGVGAAAGYFPARRAAGVEPLIALRDE